MHRDTRDAAFTEFVHAQRTTMVRAARLLTGDHAAAEDLVQGVLTRLYVKWPRVASADDPVAYAFRSLTTTFLDEARRAHRRREVTADPHDALARLGGTEAEVSGLRVDLDRALAGLGERQRAVVVLRHFLQYDVGTTARLLGCSEGTVKSQNSRALAHLRDALGAAMITEGKN